jgi:hypothetical protein
MAQFGSQLKLLPSREVQESLLNCVEEGTKIVTSLVDGLDAIRFDRTEDYNFKKSRAKYPESFSTFDMLMCI